MNGLGPFMFAKMDIAKEAVYTTLIAYILTM